MNIIIAPDSFKGTLSSLEVCSIIKKAFLKANPSLNITLVPIADGGEGSVDVFLHSIGGEKVSIVTNGANFEKIQSFYAITADKTAIIEMAVSAGFSIAKIKNPKLTTTYGVGELIKDAIKKGCKNIIVALGGSSTNDAGCGAACALGAKFYNTCGDEFIPTGGTLKDIKSIDLKDLRQNLQGISFTTMCDIDNPMHGKNGAAFVFARQKGASEDEILELDFGLAHLANLAKDSFNIDLQNIKGAGAAGAMGAGMVLFFNSKLKMGIDVVLETIKFDKMLKNTDLVISGEGNLDAQSLSGKVVVGIAKHSKKAKVRLIAIVGGYEMRDEFYELGIDAIFSINTKPQSFEISKHNAKENLYNTAYNLAKVLN